MEYREEGSEERGRNMGKIWGYVAGEGEFENRGQAPLGPQKGPQKFLKKYRKCVLKNIRSE